MKRRPSLLGIRGARGLLIVLPLASLGCRRPVSEDAPPQESAESPPKGESSSTAASSTTPPLGASGAGGVAIDAVRGFDDCVLGHLGVLLDLGDPTSRAELAAHVDRGRVDPLERDGATWAKVQARGFGLTFTAVDAALSPGEGEGEPPVVEARVRGGAARSVSVFLNGRPAGQWPLVRGETRVVSTRLVAAQTPNGAQLVSGSNELVLRFNGAGAGAAATAAAKTGASPDEQAEIDWIHVGPPDPDGTYGAPVRDAALTSVTVGGVAKRAIALRAPGFARCSGWLPAGGHVSVHLAVEGAPDADAEVRLLRDRAPVTVLGRFHLGAGDAKAFRTVDVPLGDLGGGARTGTLGALELVTTRAARGTRVLFGEPRVLPPQGSPDDDGTDRAAEAKPHAAPARGVVLVILGSTTSRALALYGGKTALPELEALASTGLVFDAHRAPSTVAAASVASLLTGLSPRAHGVSDDAATLPADVTTLSDALRQAGIATAFFTADPTTGEAFGWNRGWTTFGEHPPDAEGPSSLVFEDAAHWLEAHTQDRFFLVVHARGGHPPWDATADELKALPPNDYAGGLDPKHAGELLAKARHTPPLIRFNDADRARAWALYALALRNEDAALGRFLSALKASERADDSLVMVTSDVGLDDLAHVPFPDEHTLDEGALAIPLVVRAPAGTGSAKGPGPAAGARVPSPTTSADLAVTVLDAFGLTVPSNVQAVDLFTTAGSRAPNAPSVTGRPLVATLASRYALRWGSFVLSGARAPGVERETKLCELTLEPSCLSDVRGAFPLALEALHRVAFDRVPVTQHARTPVVLDARTMAALRAWGD